MFKYLTDDEFKQKLIDIGVTDIPLEPYKGSTTPIWFVCKNNPNHKFQCIPDNIYRRKDKSSLCMYCTRHIVFRGETDLWTERPDVATMLLDPQVGYEHMSTSAFHTDWVCPRCHFVIEDRIINNVVRFGLSCPCCSDSKSFGEKFVLGLLDILGAKYVHDKSTKWSGNKRYDFYLSDMKTIIEVHGIQHYSPSFTGYKRGGDPARTLQREIENDAYKKEIALQNGIEHYIVIDASVSSQEYLVNSIVNSELQNLFDLSMVDFSQCLKRTLSSDVVRCANLWELYKDTKEVAQHSGIDRSSVIVYLKRAAEIGLCNYETNYTKKKRVVCIETNREYKKIGDVKRDGFSPLTVSRCCRGLADTAGGKHWRFVK